MPANPKGISATGFIFEGSNQPYLRLGEALEELPEQGLIMDDEEQPPVQDPRNKIARTYLFLLGYLESDNGKEKPDKDFVIALQRFQQEANLVNSKELDTQSWTALTELAAFDTEINIGHWLDTKSRLLVLKRAVHLRLFSFGLIRKAPKPDSKLTRKLSRLNKDFQEGLNKFVRVTSLLGLSDHDLQPGLNSDTLSSLFDQSTLINKLTPKGNSFKLFKQHLVFTRPDKDNTRLLKKFIANLASTELWLLGYSVRPGIFKPDGASGRDNDSSLHRAIREFCSDNNIEGKFKRKKDITIGYWLFEELKKAHANKTSDDDEILENESIRIIVSTKSKLRKLGKTYRSLGARLIDGVKRAIMWVKGFFKKIFNIAKRVLSNLARLIHKGALIVYRRLKSVIFALKDGFDFLFSKIIKGSDPEQIYISHKTDFDLDIFVNRYADLGRVTAFSEHVSLRAQVFGLACKIISKLLDILKFILKSTGVVLGWIGLLLSLVKLGNWLREVIQISRESEKLMLLLESGTYTELPSD